MPGGKTQFNIDWLNCKDKQGIILKTWCEPNSNSRYSVHCNLCKKTVKCDNQGLSQLLQHAEGNSHKKISKDIFIGSQMTLSLTTTRPCNDDKPTGIPECTISTTTSTRPNVLQQVPEVSCISTKDNATRAELIWTMKVVASHYSYASCDGIKEIFQAMFPNSLPNNFSISSSKVSYLVSEATGPFFHKLLIADVLNSKSLYTILYDETTNKQVMKQLDIKIRYWSECKGEVKVCHLRTYLMGSATAIQISTKIFDSIEESNLPLQNLLMLGSDGPNINKSIWRIMNEKILQSRTTGLLDVGTCNLHVVFNAFKKGLQSLDKNVYDLIIDLYQWFKLSPVRKQDYGNLQESRGLKRRGFIKHVDCKWVTFLPAIERILEEWDTLLQYFTKHLPKEKPDVLSNARYLRIKNRLLNKELLIEIKFLKSSNLVFHRFLIFFQREEPLIHLLFDELSLLLQKLLSRFIKHSILKDKTAIELTEIEVDVLENQLHFDQMDIGEDVRKSLKSLSQGEKQLMLLRMRKFYEVSGKYLQNSLPFSKKFLDECRCFGPKNRTENWTVHAIKSIAMRLPIDLDVDLLADEWRVYQLDKIPEEYYLIENSTIEEPVYKRVDHYWGKVLNHRLSTGEFKYPLLTKVTKACLLLSHGNSDVERGFSESGRNVTTDRVRFSEQSVNAIRTTTDGLKDYGNQPHLVPITREFLSMATKAHGKYIQRLEEAKRLQKKKQKEEKDRLMEEETRKGIKETLYKESKELKIVEKDIAAREDSQYLDMDVGTSLFKEANDKLKKALNEKN